MDTEIQPRHHPDIRWAIIISCLTTALLVLVIAYAWNNMKKLEMEATYNRTNTEITIENGKKIGAMQDEVDGLRAIIDNLKGEIDQYRVDLEKAKMASSTKDLNASTTEKGVF
ncbi:MAG: hypothetical protein AAB390_02590 [Patescibacteria group bacterium]